MVNIQVCAAPDPCMFTDGAETRASLTPENWQESQVSDTLIIVAVVIVCGSGNSDKII